MILYPHNYFNKLIRISSQRDYISLKESLRNKLSLALLARYMTNHKHTQRENDSHTVLIMCRGIMAYIRTIV